MIAKPVHSARHIRILRSPQILELRAARESEGQGRPEPSRRTILRGCAASTALMGLGATPAIVPDRAEAAAEWVGPLITGIFSLAGVLLGPVIAQFLRERAEQAQKRPSPGGADFHARYAYPVTADMREGLYGLRGSEAFLGVAGRPLLTTQGEFNERRDLNWAEIDRIVEVREGRARNVPFGEIPADEMAGAYTGERERFDPARHGDHYRRFVAPSVERDLSLPVDPVPIYTRRVRIKHRDALGYAFRSQSTRNANDIHFRLYHA